MPLGSLLGGFIGAGGAQAAGAASAAAGNKAFDNSVELGNQINALLSSYTSSGNQADNALSQLYGLGPIQQFSDQYGDYGTATGQGYGTPGAKQAQQAAFENFKSFPGYQFALDQGLKSVNNSGSARGMTLSGAQDQALTNYGQGVASQGFGNYVGGLQNLANQGQSAASTIGQLRTQGQGAGNQMQFQGNLGQAAGYQASANALASGIASGINNLASIGGLYGPMAGSKGLDLSSFMGGGGGGGTAGGYGGFGSSAPSSSFGPFAGFGGNAFAGSGAAAGGTGAAGAGGAGASLSGLAPAFAAL